MSLQVSTSWLRTGSNGHSSAVKIVSRWTGLENVRAHILQVEKTVILYFGWAKNYKNFNIFFCFCDTAVWTQGLVLARQVLYYLSHTSSSFPPPFSLRQVLTRQPRLDLNLQSYLALPSAGITGMYHHIQHSSQF
jgi:hypothetical protein